MTKKIFLSLTILILSVTGALAQGRHQHRHGCHDYCRTGEQPAYLTHRPITSVYGLEIGGANINCNYLSPLPYAGSGTGVYGAWGKRMKQHPENLVMAFTAGLNMTSTKNPSKSAQMMSVSARFGWGPSWLHEFGNGWSMTLGGAHFGRLPVTFADSASLPTLGAFFCPQYGQSYYEIYLGERSGLAHFGWWGNCFGINNHLTMSLHFRNRKSLVLGYRLYVRNNRANHLTNQYVTNAFTVAIQIN